MSKVNLRQVASEAGLSTTTVSQILSSAPGFSYRPETIARVREATLKLGYKPNSAARLLRQKSTKLIGLAINFRATYHHPLVLHVYNQVAQQKYQPILIEMHPEAAMEMSFPSLDLLEGMMGVDYHVMDGYPDLCLQLKRQLPLVGLVPVRARNVDYVATDRGLLPYLAAEHLAALGHRRIACAMPHGNSLINEMRAQGWHRAMRDFGLDPGLSEPLRMHMSENEDIVGQKLAQAILALQSPPTALICPGDNIALATLSELMRHGWKVPEQLSIVVNGDSISDSCCYPRLTAVVPPLEQIARAGVARLIESIEARAAGSELKPMQQLLPPVLVVRESSVPPPSL